MVFLQGKQIFISGLLSNRLITHEIPQASRREGAALALIYVGNRLKDRIADFASGFGSALIFESDVGSDIRIAQLLSDLSCSQDHLDRLVRATSFAPRDGINGDFLQVGHARNFT